MHATNHPATGEHAGRLRAWFRRQDPISAWMTIIGWGCYVLAALLLAWVAGAVVHNDVLERSTADHVASAPAAWPDATKRAVLQRARAYNGTLADRFGGRIPADAADEQGNPQELADAAYMRALSVDGGGAMARLSIPKISVNIAVYHTTLDDVLSKGAGHIYGTALPVGDPHTYTVLAAHSGGVQGMLFTRLSEMRQGDVFYLDVLGGEQGYRITDVRTITPGRMERTLQQIRDAHQSGDATVTMVTCTPIGVNTDRLLVTGVRAPVPQSIPAASTQRDGTLIAVGVGVAVFALALAAAIVVRRRAKRRHGTRTR